MEEDDASSQVAVAGGQAAQWAAVAVLGIVVTILGIVVTILGIVVTILGIVSAVVACRRWRCHRRHDRRHETALLEERHNYEYDLRCRSIAGAILMDTLWQDREIRFDIDARLMALRPGEKLIDRLDSVEDTKGNNGERGRLVITNLRLIWHSHTMPRINLSIGYNCVISITTKQTFSKLKGNVEALFVLTKSGQTRFEFIFTNLDPGSPRLFASVMSVHRSYESTRLYRDLKLRNAIIADKKLKLLPQEELLSEVSGVWNLSSDQGNLGVFCVTNVRVVWFAVMNETFNISVPYLQMKAVRIRDSKFGLALVIETVAQSGGYVLGFRVDPADRLKDVTQEIQSLFRVYSSEPVYGVEFERVRDDDPRGESLLIEPVQDELEMDEGDDQKDVFAAYLADGDKSSDREVTFSPELEVAIEAVKEGYTLQDLWAVLPDTKQQSRAEQQQQQQQQQQEQQHRRRQKVAAD